jgi:hypothetical protein
MEILSPQNPLTTRKIPVGTSDYPRRVGLLGNAQAYDIVVTSMHDFKDRSHEMNCYPGAIEGEIQD